MVTRDEQLAPWTTQGTGWRPLTEGRDHPAHQTEPTAVLQVRGVTASGMARTPLTSEAQSRERTDYGSFRTKCHVESPRERQREPRIPKARGGLLAGPNRPLLGEPGEGPGVLEERARGPGLQPQPQHQRAGGTQGWRVSLRDRQLPVAFVGTDTVGGLGERGSNLYFRHEY